MSQTNPGVFVMEKKRAAAILVLLACATIATAQTTTTTAPDSGKIITEQVNKTFCSIITLATLATAGITSIVIILAGIRYMSAEDPAESSGAKTMIVYALVGMTIILTACPVIDYIISGTNIAPFHESCQCVVGSGNTTTTLAGLRCTDGTPVGNCSVCTKIGMSGTKCVPNAGNTSLIPDISCPLPSCTELICHVPGEGGGRSVNYSCWESCLDPPYTLFYDCGVGGCSFHNTSDIWKFCGSIIKIVYGTTTSTTTLSTTTSTSSSTSSTPTTTTTTTATTTTTMLCGTPSCPNPAGSCEAAYGIGRCKDGSGFYGLDTICGAGYRVCCCNNYLSTHNGTAAYTTCCG